jgi:hypothetical protein
MRALGALLVLALLPACKKRSVAPDAGAEVNFRFLDDELGVSVELLPGWVKQPTGPDAGQPSRHLEARRTAPEGKTLLVLPKIVITDDPARRTDDSDRLAEQAIADLKQIESGGRAKVRRSSTTKQLIDGVVVGEIEVDYSILDPKGDRDVVHRALVARRDLAGSPRTLMITVTYLASDQDWLGTEVDRMLRSVHFR